MSDYDILPLLQKFEAIGMKSKHVCGLLSISETTMSRARTGSAFLSGQEILDMRNLFKECQELSGRSLLPVDWSNLRPVRQQLDALRREKKNPPDPLNAEDWELLGATSPEALKALAAKRGISIADLLLSTDAAMRKFDYAINKMQKSSEEMRALTQLRQDESQARQTS